MGGNDPAMNPEPPMNDDGMDNPAPADDGMNNSAPMDGGMNNEPPMDEPMGDEPMNDNPEMGGGEGDDSTMSIINQLSPKDKEAVRAYAESMLSRDESQNGIGDEPIQESFIFTKKQLAHINENFGPMADELNDKEKNVRRMPAKKEKGKLSNKSPFSSPKFKK